MLVGEINAQGKVGARALMDADRYHILLIAESAMVFCWRDA